MRITIFVLTLGLFLTTGVQAQDNTSLSPKTSDLSLLLTSLSNILSSTNPKTIHYQNLEPAAGNAQSMAPLHTSEQVPIVEPEPALKLTAPKPKLSAETKRILRSTPAGLGGTNSKPEKITLKRGEFDPEFGSLLDGPIDKTEPPNEGTADLNGPGPEAKEPPVTAVAKPKFEISVNNSKDAKSTYELLDKALKAVNAGQYESAIAYYKLVLKRDKRNQDAMFGLAASYHKAGQRTQAREAYAQLLSAYPSFEEGLSNMLLLASEEAPADALKELDRLGAKNPNFAPIFVQKAKIYAKMGDNEKAKQNFIKALKIQPNNANYRYEMAVFLDQSGDISGASQLYSQLIDESYKGNNLPVARSQIQERLAYIASLPQKSSL